MNKTLITFFTVLFCLTSSVGWSLEYKDLVERDGIYYKKFSDVPFTGKTTGKVQGTFKNGKLEGSFVLYHDNGQLFYKGDYRNGEKDGSWITYHDNAQLCNKGGFWLGKKEGTWVWYSKDGTITEKLSGNYKNDIKISD